jgi:hypothetical protein
LFVEDSNSAPHYEITVVPRLKSEAESGREIVSVRRVDGIDAGTLNYQALPGIKTRRSLSPVCSGPLYS